jgi:energy-coupling factor transport system ATP-binding protein
VALLPQRPGDLFVHERVGDELHGADGDEALRRFGLEEMTDVDPRDLSGGERQRLALAIVVAGRDGAGDEIPGALLLARGEVAADGSAAELLSGGWYFSSEVARILDGAAITIEQGVAALLEAGAQGAKTEGASK